ncbi:MAG: PEP-CTERM sorting domain-containing protein [Cyanobacteria bacterium J06634_5]
MFSFKLISAASSAAVLSVSMPAIAVTFDLSWQGQTLGYRAEGQFSYAEDAVPGDGIVRSGDVDALDIAFFTPQGELLKSFDNSVQTPGFNFNFDTTTGEILQTGPWDSPTGLNIGGVRTEALNMFSAPNPKANFFEDDAPSPHVHLTDWGNDFPALPIGFSRGARPHLDIAFFTRTRAEVLADPDAGDALGERLVATAVAEPTPAAEVPEPATLFGLGMVAYGLFKYRSKAGDRA